MSKKVTVDKVRRYCVGFCFIKVLKVAYLCAFDALFWYNKL